MSTGRAVRRVAVIVAVLTTFGAWSVLDGSPAGAQTCGPAPAGRIAVAVVVDTGTGSPLVRCVTVNGGATGYDALAAAVGGDVRLDPRFADPFVCGLLGTPASGCDTRTQSWGYWHGVGGKWKYSTVGVGGYRLPTRCAVEGWRYGTNDTPRPAPPAVQCDASPVATTAAPAAVPGPPSNPPSNAGAPTGGAAAGPFPTMPRAPGASGAAPAPSPNPAGVAAGGAAAGPTATVAGQTTVPGAPPPPTPAAGAAPAPGTDPTAASSTTALDGPGADASSGDGRSPDRELASASAGDGPETGPGVGLIAAVTLLVALGAVAVVRHRMGRPAADLEPDA